MPRWVPALPASASPSPAPSYAHALGSIHTASMDNLSPALFELWYDEGVVMCPRPWVLALVASGAEGTRGARRAESV